VTATCLQHLVWYLPAAVKAALASAAVIPAKTGQAERAMLSDDLLSYIAAYQDLAFGWKFVRAMADYHQPFPGVVEGDDEVLFRAYLLCCDPQRYRDPSLSGALAISFASLPHVKKTLEALLLAPDATIAKVAKVMHLDYQVVLVYEKLFFNILDRKQDAHFLASVVYPDGRIDCYHPDYIARTPLDAQVRRSSHDNGMDHALHLYGYKTNLLENMAGPEAASKLEGAIMANGLFLAANGFLNQNNNAGIRPAVGLLAAAKQGGQETAPHAPFQSLGESLLVEMLQVKLVEARTAAQFKAGAMKAAKVKIVTS
jgi:hypothetical protein